ncbi:MAG: hypothetical protein H3Z52_15140 [archaeon]|nr:hypothetical protein [archaeon]
MRRKYLLPFLSLIIILNLSFSQVFVPKVDADSDDASFQLQFFSVLASVDYENKTIHEGDIIVEGNETFEIRNCEYVLTGAIRVEDNAALIMENVTLILSTTGLDWPFLIEILENAKLNLIRVKIISIEP